MNHWSIHFPPGVHPSSSWGRFHTSTSALFRRIFVAPSFRECPKPLFRCRSRALYLAFENSGTQGMKIRSVISMNGHRHEIDTLQDSVCIQHDFRTMTKHMYDSINIYIYTCDQGRLTTFTITNVPETDHNESTMKFQESHLTNLKHHNLQP